jgi:hypothetical protein
MTCLIFSSVSDDPLCFRLIQWNPSSAPANQPLSDDSSESDHYSPVPYGELDALRFKAELEVTKRELEDVSKKAGIAELEWEDQRKQLLATIDGTALKLLPNPIWLLILITTNLHFAARNAELNQLKMLVEQLDDKVNARGDTPAQRLAAVENRVDEVATHGIAWVPPWAWPPWRRTPASTTPSSRAASKVAHQKTSTRSRSSWSASTSTATPLPNPLIPSLC